MSTQATPITRPMTERISTRHPPGAEDGAASASFHAPSASRSMRSARPCARHIVDLSRPEHLADLVHVQFLLVVERDHHLLALRQRGDRLGQRGDDAGLLQRRLLVVAERAGARRRRRRTASRSSRRMPATSTSSRVILRQWNSHRRRRFPRPCLGGRGAARSRASPAARRAWREPHGPDRRPGLAPRLVDHRIHDRAMERRLAARRHAAAHMIRSTAMMPGLDRDRRAARCRTDGPSNASRVDLHHRHVARG